LKILKGGKKEEIEEHPVSSILANQRIVKRDDENERKLKKFK
jgi:hypothetical protein